MLSRCRRVLGVILKKLNKGINLSFQYNLLNSFHNYLIQHLDIYNSLIFASVIDLAVSAPYDGDGAVYIFNGKREKIHTTPSQVTCIILVKMF